MSVTTEGKPPQRPQSCVYTIEYDDYDEHEILACYDDERAARDHVADSNFRRGRNPRQVWIVERGVRRVKSLRPAHARILPRWELALATIFKAESRWLPEWIEYHRLVGVQHFFLLCHDDDPAERERAGGVLNRYQREGLVDWGFHDCRDADWQLQGWARILRRWGPQCVWLGLTDADCFLRPEPTPTVPRPTDDLVAVLRDFDAPDVAGLAVYVRTFGSAGLLEPPELQLEAFVRRAPDDHPAGRTANYVLRPDRLVPAGAHGYNQPQPGFRLVDGDWDTVPWPTAKRAGSFKRLCWNHYSIRSRADWEAKRRRGWPGYEAEFAAADPNHTLAEHKLQMLDRNEVEDTGMHRYVPALRRALQR